MAAPGPRFENLVALHLLKSCHWLEDREGSPVARHFLLDRDGHEVDFLATYERKPWFAVEVNVSATEPGPSLTLAIDRLWLNLLERSPPSPGYGQTQVPK